MKKNPTKIMVSGDGSGTDENKSTTMYQKAIHMDDHLPGPMRGDTK